MVSIAQKIISDDIKLEIIASLKDYSEIEAIARTLNSDDKKMEAIDISGACGILRYVKDDYKKIQILKTHNSSKAYYELVSELNVLQGLYDFDGRKEVLTTTMQSCQLSELYENLQETMKRIDKIKQLSDNEKIKELKTIESDYLRSEIIKTIDDEKKLETISLLKTDTSIINVTRNMPEEFKLKAIDFLDKDDSKRIIAKTLDEDSNKLKVMTLLKDDYKKLQIAFTLKNDESKMEAMDYLKSENYKELLFAGINNIGIKSQTAIQKLGFNLLVSLINSYSDEKKKESNKDFIEAKELYNKIKDAIESKDDNKRISIINSISNEKLRARIIVTIQDDKLKMDAINSISDQDLKSSIIVTIHDDKLKMDAINSISDHTLKFRIIDTIQDEKIKIDTIKMQNFTQEELRQYRQSKNIDYIKDNIKKFIEIEGFKDIIPIDIIDELYKKNNSIVRTIDFRLLNPKYIEQLGIDKINLIGNFIDIQEKFLKLGDKKSYIYSKCIDCYLKDNSTEEWTVLGYDLLNNLLSNEYDQLIESMGDLEELNTEDLTRLAFVLQNNNWFEITDKSQLENYELIKFQKCNHIMQDESATTEQKREALTQKIFGHDWKYAKNLIGKFGEDIENIADGDAKDYIKALKLIEKTENIDTFKKIFDECEYVQTSRIGIERTIKNEYAKLFNEGLYIPKESDLISLDPPIYNAGTEFKMIITSVGAYFTGTCGNNYKDEWNRPVLSSQHFCASYIRNDMIGTAPINNICYGFVDMKEDSLVLSSNNDMRSFTKDLLSSGMNIKFYTPDEQINKTNRYNEMCYRRVQNGEKKQPDYIIVFKRNGKIPNIKQAKQASKQWENMPIVVVDVDKCLKTEKQKIKKMLEEYNDNHSRTLAKEIQQKIRNNRVTDRGFSADLQKQLQELNLGMQEVNSKIIENKKEQNKITEEDLKENHKKISAADRKKEISNIRSIYKKMQEITRGDKDTNER